ncbi:MAG: aldehyde dehydrogenase family protein [Candidatus Omnitrophica bacterium]|nr:aldehyde dehydrogenase family protein [Candidatus Omnitrophota bacterium]MDD5592145.1 aldehyde dehydrogenase family protein [Candidatus Omnitrophota bacterium]
MTHPYSLFINGEFIDSREQRKIINPSTGEVIASVSVANEKDVDSAINSARTAFDTGPWPKFSLKERKEFLLKISKGILDKAGDLARLESLNTGKPIKESTFMDIPSSAKTFEHFAHNLEGYLKDEPREIAQDAQGKLLREPQGVVVLIVPWNYPLLIASWKLAVALAAGNAVILKPSSLTPLTALELAKIIQDAGLPKGVVNIIHGAGDKLGEALCADKCVDMVSFTGSNAVGRQILGYCAKQVKKLIMELGGKSASIVLKDADLESAVNGSLCSIFLNQGQMCTAMSRIFVEDDIYDKFIADFVAKAKRIKLGDSLDYETQMGPLISENQRKKVLDFIRKAKSEGAQVLCGGEISDEPRLKKGFFFPATALTGVKPAMSIFQEEVFGPVACVDKFSTLEEAVALANNSDFGLAGSIWTKDEARAKDLSGKINAGIIWINTYGMFHNEMPYGGFKQSGFGKELGREGFLEYTRLKSIITDKAKEAKPLLNYWYSF